MSKEYRGRKGNYYDRGAVWPTHRYPGEEDPKYQQGRRKEGFVLKDGVWVDER